MVLLISFLIGMQVLGSLAGLPPLHPERPPSPLPFLSPPCNSSQVKAAAEMALNEINAHRREGYVFRLQRIFDIRELPQQPGGPLFYLTLDVLETDCHVLSRKLPKDCAFRNPHEAVYGQCKATFRISRNLEQSFLYNYDCILRPLSPVSITRLCPDCPVLGDPTETRFQEAAAESLAKFNAVSNHRHYFAILNVTRARSQWVVGPQSLVEFTLQETSCPKNKSVPDLSKCPLLPPKTAETGLCRGSVVDSQIEHRKFVNIKCDFFGPWATDITENSHSGPEPGQDRDHQDGESHEDDRGHHQRGKGRHRHHHHPHHQHKHHNKHHGNQSYEHEGSQRQHPDTSQTLPELEKTVGQVTILPPSNTHVSLHSLPQIGGEQLHGKPVRPQVQEPSTNPILAGGRPVGRPSLTTPARPSIPPFPTGFSESDTCPGESSIHILGLELPNRPGVKSPSQTE
ncbi:fetuin-B-like [Elgaria multicarinata webbii]|uniref:fetuin-B-like n=1 Tax=Elgaria multicarinata webbii TaxID=159646 RepID=UPI002FCD299E